MFGSELSIGVVSDDEFGFDVGEHVVVSFMENRHVFHVFVVLHGWYAETMMIPLGLASSVLSLIDIHLGHQLC